MRCIMLTPDARMGRDWRCAIENLGEDWQCIPVVHGQQALECLESYTEVLLLTACGESRELLRGLITAPMLMPPWVLGIGFAGPDGQAVTPEELPERLQELRRRGQLPALTAGRMPEVQAVAAAFLRTMQVPPRLRAWEFLPEMAAMLVVHPPLLTDLQHGLYPMIARRHGMTPAAVERSLRLCVESTWVRGSIGALDRFFGSSVDPEKGKPTNREFLCRIREHITLGALRLGRQAAYQIKRRVQNP